MSINDSEGNKVEILRFEHLNMQYISSGIATKFQKLS